MSRLGDKINSEIQFDNISSWVDFGTGNGFIVREMVWNKTAVDKISVDKFPQYFAEDWTFVKELDDILDKKRDLFTAIDVIEHLTKEDGISLLQKIDKWFKNKLICTPRGFLRQDETTHPELMKENPWQKHISGWDVEDFHKLGYQVIILSSFHYPTGHNRSFDAILAFKKY